MINPAQKTSEGALTSLLKDIGLVRRSAASDRRTYRATDRPLTAKRLFLSLRPALANPIFIIGAPRSGTTFLGECMSCLPEVSYHFEPVGTKFAARHVYEKQWDFEKAKRFYTIVYSLLLIQHIDGDLRFAEKTPRNCFLIDFLSQAFPGSQFIHIIRDGRDAALSYSKKPWLQSSQAKSGKTEPGGYSYGPYARFWVEPELVEKFETTTDIHRCVWAWRRFTESALEGMSKLPKNRCYELRYEALVNNPADEADRLLKFMSIESPLSREQFHRAVSKAKPTSVGQWKKELSIDQQQQVEAEAGALLSKLGYINRV